MRYLYSERSQELLIWDRSSKAKDLGKLQIYGHTPNREVEFLKKWDPINEKHDVVGVNVDTAGCFGHNLSCVILPSMEVISVKESVNG